MTSKLEMEMPSFSANFRAKLESVIGEIVTVENISRGTVNRVFSLNHDWILRIKRFQANPEEDLGDFLNFGMASKLVGANLGVRIPEIIFTQQEEVDGIPAHLQLLKEIKGRGLEEFINQSPDTIAENMAKQLHLVHQIETPHFGSLALNSKRSWFDFINYWVNRQLEFINVSALLSPVETKLVREIFSSSQTLLESVKTPHLFHGDFRPENLIADEAANIVGIIDWDAATGGDPMFDLQNFDEEIPAKLKTAFLTHCQELSPDALFIEKLNLYNLFFYIKLLPVANLLWGESTTVRYISRARHYLNLCSTT